MKKRIQSTATDTTDKYRFYFSKSYIKVANVKGEKNVPIVRVKKFKMRKFVKGTNKKYI